MRTTIKELLKGVIVDIDRGEQKEFERGFLLPLSIVGIWFSLISFILNIFLGFNLTLVFVPVFSFSIFLLVYYLVKNGIYQSAAKWLFIFSVFIFVNLTWFYNFGSQSPWFFIIVLLYSYLVLMLNGKNLLLISILLFTNTIALFLFEFYYPNALGDYQNNTARLTDFYSATILFGASAYILMSLAKRFYLSEYKKAKEAEKLKSSFLANLSHEIRTPLNSIVGFSNVLAEADEDMSEEEKLKYGAIIKQSSSSLLRLINDVLDVSKIEAGQLGVKENEFCVNDLIYSLKDIYTLAIKKNDKRELVLKTQIPHELIFVTGDKERVKQVLNNLLDNAVKFTESGTIAFGFSLEDNMVHFFVEDTGIGVKAEYKDSLFDRFYKVEDDKEILYRGVGIGLYLSKKIVELLDGTIWFESTFGKGSIFHFTIPDNNLVVKEKEKPVSVRKKEKTFGKHTLLLVEDDLASMELLKQILKSVDLHTIEAATGAEVLNILDTMPEIDLVLLDIRLPDINGFDLLVKIKEVLPGVPVIAQTAFVMAGDKKKCFDAGFDDYISKPIMRDALFAKIEKYLDIEKTDIL